MKSNSNLEFMNQDKDSGGACRVAKSTRQVCSLRLFYTLSVHGGIFTLYNIFGEQQQHPLALGYRGSIRSGFAGEPRGLPVWEVRLVFAMSEKTVS